MNKKRKRRRKREKKKRKARSWTIQHLVVDCLMFVYFALVYVWICVCDALSKGHSICVRARRNHHIIRPIPVATSTRLFLLFFFAQFCHIIVVASRPNACTFFSFHTYIHSYMRCVQASSLSRTKIFLFFLLLLLLLSHTY